MQMRMHARVRARRGRYGVVGDNHAQPESGRHLYNGFIATPARNPVLRAILDDMLEHIESGKDQEYTFFLRLAWRRLQTIYPSLRSDQTGRHEGSVHTATHSRLVRLDE